MHVLISANKTSYKLVEDWACPNHLTPGTSKSHAESRKNASAKSKPNKPKKTVITGMEKPPENDGSDNALPVKYILLIIGALLLFVFVVGAICYYRAIKQPP